MLVPESVDENLVSDLIENQKLSYKQARNVLKERFPSVQGLSSRSVWRFCSRRSISSRVSTDKVTEMLMEASNKVISAFWFWQICFKILLPLFYSNPRCFFYNSLSTRTFSNKNNNFSFHFLSNATWNCNFFFFSIYHHNIICIRHF